MAFPVAHRSEDLFTEKTILFGAERPVVDRLGLCHLTIGTGKNRIR